MNVQVKHYHADNGRFCQKGFMQSIREKEQTISFCGVSAHFQNGKAKKRIRDLQDQARKMLLHAIAKWPQANTTHLWPYALAHAANVANHLPTGPDGNSSLELSSGTEVRPKLKHFHTFGCPVFALDSRLQDGKFTPKCNPRCRIGLYLGNSPRHARSISLVLYLDTAHVSPHFHVAHDEFLRLWNGMAHPNLGRLSPASTIAIKYNSPKGRHYEKSSGRTKLQPIIHQE